MKFNYFLMRVFGAERKTMGKKSMCRKKSGLFLFIALLFLFLSFTSSYADWSSVASPAVSAGWELNGASFPSATEGWAVGGDTTNTKGVLLHYSSGVWTSVAPPAVSANWTLLGASFPSATEGWAVGYDITNTKGVLLHYATPSSAPTSVPTMNEWGMLVFVLFAGVGTIYYLRRRSDLRG